MEREKARAGELLKCWKGDNYAFGVGVLDKVGKFASRFGRRAMLVANGNKWLAPWLEEIVRSIGDRGVECIGPVRGARPNTPKDDVYRIALSISKIKPDSIVAVGGGSVIDAVKAASVLASYGPSEIEPYFGTGEVTKASEEEGRPVIPVVAVQTASGSGAHLTKYSNVTDPHTGIKKLIADEAITPPAAVFDYRVTVSAPKDLTLDGALDGVAHCWEVFMGATGKSYYEEIEEIARIGIELIVGNLPKAVKEPEDLEARVALGLGTDLGGYAIMISKLNPDTGAVESGGTGAGHLGSYQLTRYLAHGRACALLNPYYTVLFADAIEEQNRVVGEIFQREGFIDDGVDLGKLGGRRLAEVVAGGMMAFSRSIGFPTTLKEAGVPPEQVDLMVEAAKDPQVRMKLQNMPVPLDVGDVDSLIRPTLQAAYTGDLGLIPELRGAR